LEDFDDFEFCSSVIIPYLKVQVKSQRITITLKKFTVPNKKKTQLKKMIVEAIYQQINNQLIQPRFKIIQKDGSIKKINKL